MIDVKNPTYFTVNGHLIDLTRIEHWGRHQGAGKFHGIQTALSVLRGFVQVELASDTSPTSSEAAQIEQVFYALQKLADYGYHIPPEVFEKSLDI